MVNNYEITTENRRRNRNKKGQSVSVLVTVINTSLISTEVSSLSHMKIHKSSNLSLCTGHGPVIEHEKRPEGWFAKKSRTEFPAFFLS